MTALDKAMAGEDGLQSSVAHYGSTGRAEGAVQHERERQSCVWISNAELLRC